MLKPTASIIVPAYNEANGVSGVLEGLKNLLDEDCEIILVDDGSSDKTAEVVAKFDQKIKLIRHEKNFGYGAAFKTGLKNSSADIIVITDADGTYPNERIPELIKKLREGNFDMVVGARIGENVKIPMIRKPAKWVINKLANYLSGIKIPDLNSGLRVMKKEAVTQFMRILPEGFSFTTTITLAMLTNGYKVEYIPIDYHKREGRSKINPIRDTLNFIQLVLRTIMYFDPLKIFLPMSLSLFFAGLLLLLYRIFVTKAFITIIIILFVASLQMLAIGMLADLIDKRIR